MIVTSGLQGWPLFFFFNLSVQFSSVAQSCPTLCDPMNWQHARPPCPSPTPGVHSNSCALSPWCHPAISSSVVPFSSCPQSLPASGSFPMSQLFAWGGQSIGVSALASVLPMNTQDWSPLGWTGWISLQSKGLSRVFSNTTVQKHQFFSIQLSSQSNSHIHTWLLEKPQPWLDGPLLAIMQYKTKSLKKMSMSWNAKQAEEVFMSNETWETNRNSHWILYQAGKQLWRAFIKISGKTLVWTLIVTIMLKSLGVGTSLVVQWLRIHFPM